MAGKDYYTILGITRSANQQDIKKAYRKMARKYHPDVNPGDKTAEDEFKKVNEAYEVLSNEDNRKKYDQFGDNWKYADQFAAQGGAQAGARDFSDKSGYADFHFGGDNIGSIFDEILRGGGGRTSRYQTRPRKGHDLESRVEVTLKEAFTGTSRTISLQTEEPCGSCGGTGQIQNALCSVCRGAGMVANIKRLEVKIPQGVKTGSRVRIADKGQPGMHGGSHGDLYLKITVRPHAEFERSGDNLLINLSLPLTTAILGGEVQVPTLKGKLALKIPPETQNGRSFRLTGQGMPHLGSSAKGDLLVKANIILPEKLSEQEKALFEQLRELRPE